jgi:hypothetical protein
MTVDAFDDAVPVPAFGPRMVCTVCGIIGAIRPAELAGARAAKNPDRLALALTRLCSDKALACRSCSPPLPPGGLDPT